MAQPCCTLAPALDRRQVDAEVHSLPRLTCAAGGTDDLSVRGDLAGATFDPWQTGPSLWPCEAAALCTPSPVWLSQCTHSLHPLCESQAFHTLV